MIEEMEALNKNNVWELKQEANIQLAMDGYIT